jgi:hypothetical protein
LAIALQASKERLIGATRVVTASPKPDAKDRQTDLEID